MDKTPSFSMNEESRTTWRKVVVVLCLGLSFQYVHGSNGSTPGTITDEVVVSERGGDVDNSNNDEDQSSNAPARWTNPWPPSYDDKVEAGFLVKTHVIGSRAQESCHRNRYAQNQYEIMHDNSETKDCVKDEWDTYEMYCVNGLDEMYVYWHPTRKEAVWTMAVLHHQTIVKDEWDTYEMYCVNGLDEMYVYWHPTRKEAVWTMAVLHHQTIAPLWDLGCTGKTVIKTRIVEAGVPET